MGRGGARRGAEDPHPHAAQGAARRSRRPRRPRAAARRGTDEDDGIRHRGRVIKIIDHPKHRVLGIFRKLPHGGGRLEPVDKKMLGKELAIPGRRHARRRKTATWSRSRRSRAPRFGLPTGRVVERLGSLKSERAVSLIAIHAHGIPHVFRRDTLAEADAAQPATLASREDWRDVPLVTIDPPDAKDHDDAVHAEPDTRRQQPRRLHRHASPSPTSPIT